MKVLVVECENLNDIYNILSYAYVNEDSRNIYEDILDRLYYLLKRKIYKDIIAYNLLQIFYYNLVFNIIHISINKDFYLKHYYRYLDIFELAIIDSRLFYMISDDHVNREKQDIEITDDITYEITEYIRRFIRYLTSPSFLDKEILIEKVLECYKCFYSQLYFENINNFRINIFNNIVHLYISS